MSKYPESTRVCSMFSNAARSGGVYYSGKLGGEHPITIMPGQRVSLVKSSKTASNGSEIWSLLVDPVGADDGNRVYESRGHQDLGSDRRPALARDSFDRKDVDSEIPF